jgi:hypothetical protein
MKFPPEFDKKVCFHLDEISPSLLLSPSKVDMRKVNLTVIRPWIAKKVVELVGFEDEVVVEYAMGLLEDKQQPVRVFCWSSPTPLDTRFRSEPRSQKDADQSNRLFDKGYSFFYDFSLGPFTRSTGFTRWYPPHLCRREEAGDEIGKRRRQQSPEREGSQSSLG